MAAVFVVRHCHVRRGHLHASLLPDRPRHQRHRLRLLHLAPARGADGREHRHRAADQPARPLQMAHGRRRRADGHRRVPDDAHHRRHLRLGALGHGCSCSASASARRWPGYTVVVQNSVPMDRLGVATSTLTFLRQIGASVGLAAAGTIFSSSFAGRLPANLAQAGRASAGHRASWSKLSGSAAERRQRQAPCSQHLLPGPLQALIPKVIAGANNALALSIGDLFWITIFAGVARAHLHADPSRPPPAGLRRRRRAGRDGRRPNRRGRLNRGGLLATASPRRPASYASGVSRSRSSFPRRPLPRRPRLRCGSGPRRSR